MLIVGGGGGFGYSFSSYGGSGGGGQLLYYTNDSTELKTGNSIFLRSGSYNITIGNGGTYATNGESTIITNNLTSTILYIAKGGGGGGTIATLGGGGDVGGAGGTAKGYSPYTAYSTSSNGGGNGSPDDRDKPDYGGSGGGGAAFIINKHGSYYTGGQGADINITGTSIGYAGGGGSVNASHGGGGKANNLNYAARQNSGGGAGFGGVSGGSGILIIKFIQSIKFNYIKSYKYTDKYIKEGYYGDWVIIKMPYYVTLYSFTINIVTNFTIYAPSKWKLYASIDGINYIEIINGGNSVALTAANYISNAYTKIIDNSDYYMYYGIVVNEIIGDALPTDKPLLFNNIILNCYKYKASKLITDVKINSENVLLKTGGIIDGDLITNGNTILNSNLIINSNLNIQGTSLFSNSIFQSNATTPNYFMGNVGIGTTNPISNLTIQGSSFHSDIASFSNSIFQSNSTTPNYFMGNVNIGTVGISTHKLNVEGNINATSFFGDGGKIANVNTSNIIGATAIGVLQGGTGATSLPATRLLIGNNANAILSYNNLFYNSSSSTLNITGKILTSNIGIGSTDFGSNLYVSGSANSVIMGNLGIGTTNPISNLTIQGSSFYSDIASFSNSIFQSNATTPNYFMGNVSIGTVGISSDKLNVNGTINAIGYKLNGQIFDFSSNITSNLIYYPEDINISTLSTFENVLPVIPPLNINYFNQFPVNYEKIINNDMVYEIYGSQPKILNNTNYYSYTGSFNTSINGNFTIISFTTSGTFQLNIDLIADILIVGGGAGGQNAASGSGGGGEVKYSTNNNLMILNYNIVVGNGGYGGTQGAISAGGASSFNSITANGGNIGTDNISNPSIGGSSGNGNPGGSGGNQTRTGGGGAGGAGSGGTGGAGISNSISGANISYGNGGQQGVNAVANTGRGGGSGTGNIFSAWTAGASGASGVVIIKFLTPNIFNYPSNIFNILYNNIIIYNDNYTSLGVYNGSNYINSNYKGEFFIIKLPFPIVLKSFNFIFNTSKSYPNNFNLYASTNGINYTVIFSNSVVITNNGTFTGNILSPFNEQYYMYFGLVINTLTIVNSVLHFSLLRLLLNGKRYNKNILISDPIVNNYNYLLTNGGIIRDGLIVNNFTVLNSNLAIQGIASFSNSIFQSNATTPNYFMGNVSIGTVGISTHKLNVDGNINAISFSGNGSALTNLDPVKLSAAVPVNKGGTGKTTIAANRILYTSALDTFTESSNLTFDGNLLAINTSTIGTPTSISTWSGAKITIFSSSPLTYPYAIGYNTNSFIFSIPTAGGFNWYADSNIIMRLTSGGELSVVGDIIAFNNLSDINLKTNIKSLNINCIDLINKINPIEFTWKDIDDIISDRRNKTDYGFIAQEIELLIPTLIYDSKYKSKYKLIKYDKFAPYFVKAIQELHKIIIEQKTEIEELKTEINNIKLILANNNLS
jgi:hypothetical protein